MAMDRAPKHIKRALRDLAAAAHEEELRRALLPLQAAFERWSRKELSSGELCVEIHKFHQGPARKLFLRYNSGFLEPIAAHAIVTGLVDKAKVAPETLAYLARAIRFYEEQ